MNRFPQDPAITNLVGDLRHHSADFARLWERHDVQGTPTLTKTFHNSIVGALTLDCDSMLLQERHQFLVLYSAPAHSPAAEALAFLELAGVDQRGSVQTHQSS